MRAPMANGSHAVAGATGRCDWAGAHQGSPSRYARKARGKGLAEEGLRSCGPAVLAEQPLLFAKEVRDPGSRRAGGRWAPPRPATTLLARSIVTTRRSLARIELLVDRPVAAERNEHRRRIAERAEVDRTGAPQVTGFRMPGSDADRTQDAR